MNKYVPIEKQSKKKQKEYHAKHRNDWGCMNPVTRSVPNGKGYNRKKIKATDLKSSRMSRFNDDYYCSFCFNLETLFD